VISIHIYQKIFWVTVIWKYCYITPGPQAGEAGGCIHIRQRPYYLSHKVLAQILATQDQQGLFCSRQMAFWARSAILEICTKPSQIVPMDPIYTLLHTSYRVNARNLTGLGKIHLKSIFWKLLKFTPSGSMRGFQPFLFGLNAVYYLRKA
jgi:hypothetical protein